MIIECLLLGSSLCHALKDRPVLALAGAQSIAMTEDYEITRRDMYLAALAGCPRCFNEINPLARPLIHHPAAVIAVGTGETVLAMWLGHKIRASKHPWFRRLWWMPQTVGIGGGLGGIVYSLKNWKKR